MRGPVALGLFVAMAAGSLTALPARAEYPIAGVTPNQRPEGAPVVRDVARSSSWEQRFFYGVTQPYPASLRWAQDQGAWFTPFDRPGMTGPYDLRGWHRKKGQ